MIPKQLFFIWFGDTQPNYVNFSIDAFKEVNPDFKINFLRYTVSDIENLTNSNCIKKFDMDVYEVIQYILNDRNDIYPAIKEYKQKRKFCQTLCNILRLHLLNKYGGIYLDCDTFPIKPFDDWLLKQPEFCCNTFLYSDKKHRERDCHFLGKSQEQCFRKRYQEYYVCVNTQYYNFLNDLKWQYKRQLFFDCKLNFVVEDCEYYIEHFLDRTWLNNKTPICKYDT
jgi:hypothetical protein